jgi:ADP-ribose pyrophosphatase YjhB (NUDIX family)
MKSPVVRVRALIVHNDHILLIRRIKEGKKFYSFPGGHVEKGESDRDGLIREVKEETNLDIKPGELLEETRNRKGHKVKIFQCRVLGVDQAVLPEVRIVGEERERSTKDNQYHLEWVHIDSFRSKGVKFAGNVSIIPDAVR